MNTKDITKDIAERFKRDTANHVMTVLHDDGLYRHLRFANPDSSFYWFEIVTWPNVLTIRGDVGTVTFSRGADMFTFFRGRAVNPSYWAEKTPDHGRSLREYSEDLLKAELSAALTDYEEDYPDLAASGPRPKTPEEIRELIANYEADGSLAYEDGARELLAELEQAGVVSDTWEWDLSEWKWTFLWCCHAIVHAIAQYDAYKAAGVPVPAHA